MYFDELPLDDRILDALDAMHFEECTPIQEQAIPPVLQGRDLIGIAQTGTGKTAAYLLPILSRLCSGNYPRDAVNCLIMSPTRELAQQIDQAMEGFSYFLPFSSVAIYGGNDGIRFEQERRSLATGADVVIATPGRLISHLQMGKVDFSKVSFLILDEADRMLDMGFYDDIMTIVKELPVQRQTLLFSATMPDKIQELAQTILHDPVEVKIAVSKPADNIKQMVYFCTTHQKIGLLQHIFKQVPPERVLIFASSKQAVKELTIELKRKHFNVEQMHSDLEQKERDQVMNNFRARRTGILVATDIVSRGIDIDDIQMVINYDVPHHGEDYIHRIGRTARAGQDGMAVTFVNERDVFYFNEIERKFLDKPVERGVVPEELGGAPSFGNSGEKRAGGRPSGRRSGRGHSRGGGRASTGRKPANDTQAAKREAAPNADRAEGDKSNNNRRRRHRGGRRHKRRTVAQTPTESTTANTEA